MNRMTLKREDEIRIAVTDGRIDGDTDGDWQDFATELLRELDETRRERNWRISQARSEIMRYGLVTLPTLRDTPDAQDALKAALHDIETPLLADTPVPPKDS